MFKKIKLISAFVFMMLIFVGCSSVNKSIAYTYAVETGDKVVVSLNTLDNYSLTSKIPFAVSKEGNVLSQGIFITSESYSEYMKEIESNEEATLIDSGVKDGNEYIFWSYNKTEYNYAILIGDSKTGAILGNAISEESAKECFNRLEFSIAK